MQDGRKMSGGTSAQRMPSTPTERPAAELRVPALHRACLRARCSDGSRQRPMTRRGSAWELLQGETLLGTLTLQTVDQPCFYTKFEPAAAFEPLCALFAEEVRLLLAIDPDAEDWTAFDAIDEQIRG